VQFKKRSKGFGASWSIGVRRRGAKRVFPPLEIATKKEKLLENVKSGI